MSLLSDCFFENCSFLCDLGGLSEKFTEEINTLAFLASDLKTNSASQIFFLKDGENFAAPPSPDIPLSSAIVKTVCSFCRLKLSAVSSPFFRLNL